MSMVSFWLPPALYSNLLGSAPADKLDCLLEKVRTIHAHPAASNIPYFFMRIASRNRFGIWDSELSCDKDVKVFDETFASFVIRRCSAYCEDALFLLSNSYLIRLENRTSSVFIPNAAEADVFCDEENYAEVELKFQVPGRSSRTHAFIDRYVVSSINTPLQSERALVDYLKGLDFWGDLESVTDLFENAVSGCGRTHDKAGKLVSIGLFSLHEAVDGANTVRVEKSDYEIGVDPASHVVSDLYFMLKDIRIIGSGTDSSCQLPDDSIVGVSS